MNVVVRDLMVNYRLEGSGKQAIVMLHGWGDTMAGFDSLAERLSKRYKVIRLDLPGAGGTQAPHEPWTLDDYGQFVADFLKKLKLTPHAIIGHSNGGAISIKGVATGVLKVDKLVLIASSGIRQRVRAEQVAWMMVAKTGKFVTAPLPMATKKRLKDRLYGAIGSDYLVAPHMKETFKNITNEDIQGEALMLDVPTLVISGDDDRSTPLSHAKLFHKAIQGSRLEVLKDAGHFVHQQYPDDVAKLIEGFLK